MMKITTIILLLFIFSPHVKSQDLAFTQLAPSHSSHTILTSHSIQTDSSILFKMSQLLTIVGDYQAAATYQRQIVQRYQHQDIHNQAGIIFVLAALDYVDPKALPYILPLELDAKTRLSNTKKPAPDTLGLRVHMLQEAIEQFNAALKLDENYIPAYLNKGCALSLLGAFDSASVWLIKGAAHCSTQKMTTDFLVMEGLKAAMKGDKTAALQFLEKAKTIGSYLAVQNLDVLNNKVVYNQVLPGPAPTEGIEQIEWYPLTDFVAHPVLDQELKLSPALTCGIKQKQLSRLHYHAAILEKKYAVFQETDPKYTGETLRAIILSSTADNIQEAYGVPKRVVSLPEGPVWVYPDAHIYFRFNHRRVLQNWGVYLKSGE